MTEPNYNLEAITREFGLAYSGAKQSETAKIKSQKVFFDACTHELESGTLAQRLIKFSADDLTEAREYIERWCPGWRYVSHDDKNILVKEDPALMKYQYINTDDGYVYGRTFTEGGPSLDEEALRSQDPDLWDEISDWPHPWYTMFFNAIKGWTQMDDTEVADYVSYIFKLYGIVRTPTDPSGWTEDQVERVKPYMYPGKISPRLVPPRKATKEELGVDQ